MGVGLEGGGIVGGGKWCGVGAEFFGVWDVGSGGEWGVRSGVE